MTDKPQIQKVYDLSPMQEGMLFHYQLDTTSNAYFEQTIFTLKGYIDINLFEKSFNLLIKRHDVLRTIFFYQNVQKFSQVVLKERLTSIHFEDITQLDNESKLMYIDEFLERDRQKGFDLTKDILIRVSILKMSEEEYKLIWSFHHILMDGWCLGIIIKEALQVYSSLLNNDILNLETAPAYKDYIDWLKLQDKEAVKTYWADYLRDYENQASIPTKPLLNTDRKYSKEDLCIKMNSNIAEGLSNLAKKNKTTLNTVFQAIWGIILQKYNNTSDVVFGAVVSGRGAEIEGIEDMIGLFINTIPVRVKCHDRTSFTELILQIQKENLTSEKYSYCSIADIQQCSALKNNLINHIVAYENHPLFENLGNANLKNEIGFTLEGHDTFEQTNYDLNIVIIPNNGMDIIFKYNSNVYDSYIIEALAGKIIEIAERLIQNADISISDLDIVNGEEKSKILFDFNNTKTQYPDNKTIDQLFEEQVIKTPNNIAVISDNEASDRKTLTYIELNQRANQLAKLLRDKGVKADNASNNIVAIMVERSLEMVIGMLAILKAGGAYLPIDLEYPQQRIQHMLNDTKVNIVLTTNSLINKDLGDREIIKLDDESIYQGSGDNLLRICESQDITNTPLANTPLASTPLAYIMYTSGSTGNPKGVLVEHKGVIRLVKNMNYMSFEGDDRILQTGAIAFDACTFEVWGALLNGLELYIIDKNKMLDADELEKVLKTNKITVLFLTTSLFNRLAQHKPEMFSELRYLLTGGDVISPKYINMVGGKCKELKLINCYGPTENTTFSTYYLINGESELNIPIGKPISNSKAYIIDRFNKLCPIGAVGELCVAGDGLALGYLNNIELTAEKFIENPYCAGERIYRTGDLARWLPDGNIDFLGRIDHQIKLRGYRIELGEIESKLRNHTDIKETVVLLREDSDDNKYLCAYFTSEKELTTTDLRNFLSRELPAYMIPKVFIELDKLPLNANGKVDKKELLNFKEQSKPELEQMRSRNRIEEFLINEICKVMSIDNIGINDNLFDRGATSLDIMKITQRIKNRYEIDYNYVFQFPYISEIAKKVKPKQYDIATYVKKIREKQKTDPSENHLRSQVEKEYQQYINESKEECSSLDLSKTKNYKNILLAGATGYLGIYLLKDILENTNSNLTVIIRAKTIEEANNRLKQKLKFYFDEDIYNKYSNRLQVLNGELSEVMLGLSNIQYAELINSIDCIINSAANVKHFGFYEDFYKPNIVATQNLLEICNKADKKDYFHISTMSVGSGYVEDKEVQFFSEYLCDIGQSTDNYYLNTKLEAEKLVIEARQSGINTTIFRMGNLVYNSKTGKFQENIEDNAFYKIVRSLVKLGCLPNEDNKYAEFTFIDSASKAIILLFNKNALQNQIFHITNTNIVRYAEFLDLTANTTVKIDIIELNDFLDLLISNYDDPIMKHHVDTVLIHTEMLDDKRYTKFLHGSDRTNLILSMLGFNWDKVTKEHIKKMHEYGAGIGFFEE